MSVARVLIIAGSDSGGGAGIQADIKTVTMLGGHAMTAITAITAQNTLGVQAVMAVPAPIVLAQIDSVAADIGVDAVKIGMIGSASVAHMVADRLEGLAVPIVFDPVMVSTSGSSLADADTIAAFERLMAIASITTPNIPESEVLGGPNAILSYGCHVLLKGGHREESTVFDTLFRPNGGKHGWAGDRIRTDQTHGTGCTLASGIATGLGQGMDIDTAVERAIRYVRATLINAPGLGKGHGPVGHALGHHPFDVLED